MTDLEQSDENRRAQTQGPASERPPRRRQASPIELSAILMDTVCGPAAAGDAAVAELAEFLELPAERLQAELMFVRAFAVDFANSMALGESAEHAAIQARYYEHWEGVSSQAGADVMADLEHRLQYYGEAIGDAAAGAGLMAQVGEAFAALCQPEEGGADELAVLGGSMFAALFEEVCDLLSTVDIVLLD